MTKKISFEESLQLLEEAVEQLEDGQLPLEESLRVFEKGVAQATQCRKALQQIELKVEKLVASSDGSLQTEAMESDDIRDDSA